MNCVLEDIWLEMEQLELDLEYHATKNSAFRWLTQDQAFTRAQMQSCWSTHAV